MRDDLLLYYERELDYLRKSAAQFAEKHPKVASRLVLEPTKCEDPHVERLLEAFAFLTARVHLKMEDEFPEITEALLTVVYPQLVRPIPSMSVVEFQLDPEKGNEERALALLEEDLRSEYRNCRICFRIGTPFEQIVHEAENLKASLIVMSSHSYGWLDRIVHGSAAEMILHSTPCPVLVVKEPGKAQRSELA